LIFELKSQLFHVETFVDDQRFWIVCSVAPQFGHVEPAHESHPAAIESDHAARLAGNGVLQIHPVSDLDCALHHRYDAPKRMEDQPIPIVRIISGGRESGNLQKYLDGNHLFSKDFRAGSSFPFRIPRQPTIAAGREATGLIEICELYLEAG